MEFNRVGVVVARAVEWGVVLALVALFAWNVSAFHIPGLIGDLRDDGAYATFARALAHGLGYVDTSQIPPTPARRYPIGFPAVLAPAAFGITDPFEIAQRMQWIQIGVGALFVLVSYVFLRYRAGMPALVALLCTALISCNPSTLYFTSLLVSDVLFALMALTTVMVADYIWQKEGTKRWLWVGVLVGLTFLVRYYAVCLVLAVLLPLLLTKRWRPALFAGLGMVITTAPWFVYRWLAGGETYVAEVGQEFVRGDASFFFNLTRATANLFTQGVARFFAPSQFAGDDPLLFAPAVLVTGVVLLGLARWILRGDGRLAPVSGLFLFFAVGLAWMMEAGYPMYKGGLYIRYLIVAAPMYCAAAMIAWRQLPPARNVVAASVRQIAVVGTLGAALYTLPYFAYDVDPSREMARSEWVSAYRFVADKMPRDARFLCWSGQAFAFYTGRPMVHIPLDTQYDDAARRFLNPALFGALMYAENAQYIFCSPQTVETSGLSIDLTPRMIRNFDMRYPEVLKVVYRSEQGRLAVCQIDRKRLDVYIKADK
jgi:hypothetical protein